MDLDQSGPIKKKNVLKRKRSNTRRPKGEFLQRLLMKLTQIVQQWRKGSRKTFNKGKFKKRKKVVGQSKRRKSNTMIPVEKRGKFNVSRLKRATIVPMHVPVETFEGAHLSFEEESKSMRILKKCYAPIEEESKTLQSLKSSMNKLNVDDDDPVPFLGENPFGSIDTSGVDYSKPLSFYDENRGLGPIFIRNSWMI
ncbi:hypothetical protein GOP47_0015985 [Adiantum capillus-veneris]|uniref:Uncharacterized protein n=1 Tax=Adiantum capillus-veneris TaxID=13818 RepID=A0A9D4ZC43_ADICA|nr:hypothetical protein GOP47_0015985 [Adiantum capillus-veneris]